MRHGNNPSWNDYSDAVVTNLRAAVKVSGLPGFRVSGGYDAKTVNVSTPIKKLNSMPYVSVALVDWTNGHNESNAGNPAPHSKTYTDIGGDKYVEVPVARKERITFIIEVMAQQYPDVIQLLDVIHQYFGPVGTMGFTWEDEACEVSTTLQNYALNVSEGSKSGEIEFFAGSYSLVLKTSSDSITASQISTAVKEVETDIATQLNTQVSDTLTKTI